MDRLISTRLAALYAVALLAIVGTYSDFSLPFERGPVSAVLCRSWGWCGGTQKSLTAQTLTAIEDGGVAPDAASTEGALTTSKEGTAVTGNTDTGAAVGGRAPAAPDRLSLARDGSTVYVRWRDRSDDELRFEVERTDSRTFAKETWFTRKNATETVDSSARTDTEYRYRVAACNDYGCSFSTEIALLMPYQLREEEIASVGAGGAPLEESAATVGDTAMQEAAAAEEPDQIAALSAYVSRTPFGRRITTAAAGERVVLSIVSTRATGVVVNVAKDGLLREQFRAVPRDSKGRRWQLSFLPSDPGLYRFSLFLENGAQVVGGASLSLEVSAPLENSLLGEGTNVAGVDGTEETREGNTRLAAARGARDAREGREEKAGGGEARATDDFVRESSQNEASAAFAKEEENGTQDVPEQLRRQRAARKAFTEAQEEKRGELLRTYGDAAACDSDEACREVCAASTEVQRYMCLGFIGTDIVPPTVRSMRSMLSVLDDEAISRAIESQKITFARTPRQLRSYCTNPENDQVCRDILTEVFAMEPTALNKIEKEVKNAREKLAATFLERVGARAHLDADGDGVTDYDERRIYGTDPQNPDTDADGEWDGNEIALHRNPLARNGTAAADPSEGLITYEDPRVAGMEMEGVLAVAEVAPTSSPAVAEATSTKLELRGQAPPNAYVTLFIFSDPIVVTVKADEDGSWSFVLDQELHDGTHEVYSAITNSAGAIVAKSPPLFFIKKAEAVTITDKPPSPLTPAPAAPVDEFPYLLAIGGIVAAGAALIAAITLFGYLHQRRVGGVRLEDATSNLLPASAPCGSGVPAQGQDAAPHPHEGSPPERGQR